MEIQCHLFYDQPATLQILISTVSEYLSPDDVHVYHLMSQKFRDIHPFICHLQLCVALAIVTTSSAFENGNYIEAQNWLKITGRSSPLSE